MALPLKPPIKPQLALSRKVLPEGEGWAYEPKYDGFRAIVYVDGDDVYMQSRGGKPLRRYFPEVRFPEGRYVLDGELVILDPEGREEFDALQNRLHPAESRVRMLAEKTPALFRAFDLLARDGARLLTEPFADRRAAQSQDVALDPPAREVVRDRDDERVGADRLGGRRCEPRGVRRLVQCVPEPPGDVVPDAVGGLLDGVLHAVLGAPSGRRKGASIPPAGRRVGA